MPYNYIPVRKILTAWLILGSVAMLVCPAIGLSQTRLTWPDSRVDVTKYSSLESCLAMAKRVGDSVYAHSDTLTDTLPATTIRIIAVDTRLASAQVKTAVRQCLAHVSLETVPLKYYLLAQELYLIAGQDTNAVDIINRRLSAVPKIDSAQRTAVLDTVIQKYVTIAPLQIEAIHSWAKQLASARQFLPWQDQLSFYFLMVGYSKQFDRDAQVQQYGQELLTIARSLLDTLKLSEDRESVRQMMLFAKRMMLHDVLLDSLRKSTASYANLRAQMAAEVQQIDLKESASLISPGHQAPELNGDFVFPATARNDRLPRAGKTSLVIRVLGDQRRQIREFSRNVVIRRLKRQFPDLDIIVVATTTGAVVPLVPPSPAEEAELFNKMLFDYGKVPVTLVVSSPPFIRVPDPDRRRLNQPSELEERWSWLPYIGSAVLIDKAGMIVDAFSMDFYEKELMELIQVVYERDQGG